ncbi:GntR family transcriptional regulator [Microbacterium phyllosphaerae]|uniref:GntR family transcriptional regulator n=1 Tax=Microbacterium phyllosphaerae TaxID=124798 RepID=A0ABS4WNN5_9MICO|nr:GntR family transcriptional regulator [Microbacterium phyllosphaerae]MBP2377818.1 GntR family transcriptional regulator [Microbacterium phyllosphaerae]
MRDDVMTIDRRSPVPFYSQLKSLMLADIAARGLEPGDRIPTERELCDTYDVSRTVVRQTLLELEHEGVISREKGRGTFLADRRSSAGFGGALVGTFEDIQSEEGHQHSRVIRRGIVPAPPRIADDLSLDEGAEVVEIERIREVDGVPWAFTRTHLPLDIGRPLLDVPLEDVSLFGILEREFGVTFDRARRSFVAELASQQVADALRVDLGSPILAMRSVSFDESGRAVERFAGFHRGDLSRLDVEVQHTRS